jgi:hypothetical protein
MQTLPIDRQDGAQPLAPAGAACEVRSTALFGILDDAGLDRIHNQIATLTLGPGATVYDRSTAGLAGVLTLAPGCSALLDRAALRRALLAEGAA